MVCFWLFFFKVNVVSFNTEASTDGGSDVTSCFSERLALAVPENIRSLKDYIDGPKFIVQRKLWVFFTTIVFYPGKLPSLRSSRFPFLLGQAGQARKAREAKKEQKRRERRGGGGEKTNCFLFFPAPPHPVPFFLARPFALAPLGLKETETTSMRPTSSRKRPLNPYSRHLWEPFS